jgi:class 3 adenylate cyclase
MPAPGPSDHYVVDEQGYSLALRRLRFDDDLEGAFRRDYHLKSLPFIRFVAVLFLAVLWIEMIISGLAGLPGDVARSHRWTFAWLLGAITPCFVAVLVACRRPAPERWLQALLVLSVFAVSVWQNYSTAPRFADLPPVERDFQFMRFCLFTSVLFIATYTIVRLRFMYAALTGWAILLAAALNSVYVLDIPADRLQGAAYALCLLHFIGLFTCYTIERSARADFLSTHLLWHERQKAELLLLNILPGPIATRLKAQPGTIADSFAEVSVLFADIVDFTSLSARMSAEEVVRLLNVVFSEFDSLAEQRGLEKIKTIGDAYMVVGGLPMPREDHAEAIAEMALDMRRALERIGSERGLRLRMRYGVNIGPVTAGVIGMRRFIYDLWGDTVNVASRMEAQGVEDGIQVTEAVYQRLRTHYTFQQCQPIHVKGRGEMTPYLLINRRDAPSLGSSRSGSEAAADA